MRLRRIVSVLAGVTGLILALATPATATAPRTPAASPGYWLITGYGTSYAYNAPYLGSPESYGSDQCVNSAASNDPPYDCVGLSAAPGGTGYWIGAGATGAAASGTH